MLSFEKVNFRRASRPHIFEGVPRRRVASLILEKFKVSEQSLSSGGIFWYNMRTVLATELSKVPRLYSRKYSGKGWRWD